MKNRLFSVKEVIWATEEKDKMKFKVRSYVIIKSGLTWEEAKELRKTNRHYEIFPEVIK